MSIDTVDVCYLPVDKELINLFKEFLEIEGRETGFELPMFIERADGDGHIEIILRKPL